MEEREAVAREIVDGCAVRRVFGRSVKEFAKRAVERRDLCGVRRVRRQRGAQALAHFGRKRFADEAYEIERIPVAARSNIDERGVDAVERGPRHQAERAHQPNSRTAASQTAARRSRRSCRP